MANEKNDVELVSIGLFLGEEKNKKFISSLALLELLSKESDKKIYLDEKGEWLFVCGRDIFAESISKADFKDKGLVLVQNLKERLRHQLQISYDLLTHSMQLTQMTFFPLFPHH